MKQIKQLFSEGESPTLKTSRYEASTIKHAYYIEVPL